MPLRKIVPKHSPSPGDPYNGAIIRDIKHHSARIGDLLENGKLHLYLDFFSKLEYFYLAFSGLQISQELITNPDFLNLIQEYEKFVFSSNRYNPVRRQILESEKFKSRSSFLREFFMDYEVFLETIEALNIIENGVGSSIDIIERTKRLASIEGQKAGISKDSRVLFIGSGSLPESAISIQQTFGCPVDCLDANHQAVVISKKVLAKFGLGDSIDPLHGKGERMDIGQYSHIYLAAFATPKKALLENILRCKRGTQTVVCRYTDPLRSICYSDEEIPLDGFHVLSRLPGKKRTIMSSLVLRS